MAFIIDPYADYRTNNFNEKEFKDYKKLIEKVSGKKQVLMKMIKY